MSLTPIPGWYLLDLDGTLIDGTLIDASSFWLEIDVAWTGRRIRMLGVSRWASGFPLQLRGTQLGSQFFAMIFWSFGHMMPDKNAKPPGSPAFPGTCCQ